MYGWTLKSDCLWRAPNNFKFPEKGEEKKKLIWGSLKNLILSPSYPQ